MLAEKGIEIHFPPKSPIQCVLTAKNTKSLAQTPSLIFTHGAGGTLKADAVVNFTNGFAQTFPMVCFQGNMNLKSRVKMFDAVIERQKAPLCLGGRSMGARAAVLAATSQTTHLVLVSYPLHTDKETRDQILLDLPASMKVLFMGGDRDAMCDMGRLQNVRKKMKCKSWMVVVEGADHGMNMKSGVATQKVGEKTGEIATLWLEGCNENARGGRVVWDVDGGKVQWSGWVEESITGSSDEGPAPAKEQSPRTAKGG
ncbi:MAG: hypothetical protein Q9164_007429 [Protoblastenia rupestris]